MGMKAQHGDSKPTGRLTEAISESRSVFINFIWPLWSERLKAGRLISTEDSQENLDREADFSGTDGFFVRRNTGILIPIASRIEYFDKIKNNPFVDKYWDHYPRFTTRIAKRRNDGSLNLDVECRKRINALEDPVSRRYLPLYTFQSLVIKKENDYRVIQSSLVNTESLFEFIKKRKLYNIEQGAPSFTKQEMDVYRIVTVEKLSRAAISVKVIDNRPILTP